MSAYLFLVSYLIFNGRVQKMEIIRLNVDVKMSNGIEKWSIHSIVRLPQQVHKQISNGRVN